MWIVLSVSLLLGALAVAPAVASGHQVVTAVEAVSLGGGQVMAADGTDVRNLGEQVHDIPPLMAETALAAAPPKWMAAWVAARTAAVVRILPCLPDEPPKRMA